MSECHTCGGAVICTDTDATVAGEHLAKFGAEAVVEPGIEERVAAGRTHGAQVTQQLDEQEVALVDEADVDVAQHVEHVDGQPARGERRHQERHESERLPLARSLRLGLVARSVARRHAVAQLDGDAQVGDADGREREHVGEQQRGVGVRQALRLLAEPELLADGEAGVAELHMVGVRHRGSHQPAGQQPDARQHVGTCRH